MAIIQRMKLQLLIGARVSQSFINTRTRMKGLPELEEDFAISLRFTWRKALPVVKCPRLGVL